MLLLDRQSVTAIPRRGGSDPVQLRLQADGQLLELPLGKTTIGSSPRCNLRIPQPGVQPLHCLIVRGPEGLSVRRWAADSQLNGLPFDDAPLSAGDRLVLGGVELELVISQPAVAKAPAECVPAPADNCDELLDSVQESVETIASLEAVNCKPRYASVARERDQVPSQLESLQEAARTAADAADIVFQELQAACAVSRGRSRKMLVALRAEREQNQELRQRLAEADEQLAGLHQQRTTWENSRDHHAGDQRDWQFQVQELRQQFSAWENRLAEQEQRISELQQELVAARSSAAPVAAPANTTVHIPALEVAAREIEPVLPTDSHRPIADSWANAPSAPAPVIASQIDEPQVGGESLSDERSPFVVDEDKPAVPAAGDANPSTAADIEPAAAEPVAEAVAETAEVVEATPVTFQPTSFIERYSHLLAEDAATEPASAVAPRQPLATNPRTMDVVRNENGSVPAAATENEESVEQYMAKLLQRMRGDTPFVAASQGAPTADAAKDVAPAAITSSPQASAPASAQHAQPAAEKPESAEEAAQALVDWEAIARRAVAAAPSTDMGALRALANDSARRAISHHKLKQYRRDAVTKVIVSTLAGMTGLWLMLESPNWRNTQFIAACVLMIVAAYWAGQTLRTTLESLRAAAYDGSETAHDGSAGGRHSLPIDVEKRR